MMHILIPTGGSAHSAIAIHQVLMLAAAEEIIATLLTVVKHADDQAEAEMILAQAREGLDTAVSQTTTLIRSGQPAEEIVQEAESGGYDLIVMGERPSHNLITRLFKPVTQHVVERSTCPVLIAKEQSHPLHRLLLCDSGLQSPSLLDRFTASLPQLLTADTDITILHVMSQISAAPGIPGQQLRADADELIAENAPEGELLQLDREKMEHVGHASEIKVRHGLVVDEIETEARNGDYDLIVIGAHQHAGWHHFLLADMTRQIITQADRPVLVIPFTTTPDDASTKPK
jgi:nucleotide-binding universal stress UspA family protein